MKLLIVDNSPIIAKKLQNELADASIDIRSISTSGGALMTAHKWSPNVIISGVVIDDINGFDVCMLLKLIPDCAGIPVIIISSGESDEIKKKAAFVGADYYIPKDRNLVGGIRSALDTIRSSNAEKTREPKELMTENHQGEVLVVDDSSIMRRIVTNMLHTLGISAVSEAPDGAKALERIKSGGIGLVLSDWNMPVMNGLDLVKAIRLDPQNSDLPVVMVTTESGARERQIAADAGANDTIGKPFTKEKMQNVLSQFNRCIKAD
jgi:two-component system chemotaxis response regulator CheY